MGIDYIEKEKQRKLLPKRTPLFNKLSSPSSTLKKTKETDKDKKNKQKKTKPELKLKDLNNETIKEKKKTRKPKVKSGLIKEKIKTKKGEPPKKKQNPDILIEHDKSIKK